MGMILHEKRMTWERVPVFWYEYTPETEALTRKLERLRAYMAALREEPKFREEARELIEHFGAKLVRQGWPGSPNEELAGLLRSGWEEALERRKQVAPRLSEQGLKYGRALRDLAERWDLGSSSVAACRAGEVVEAIRLGSGPVDVHGGWWEMSVVDIELPCLEFRFYGADYSLGEVRDQIHSVVDEMVEKQYQEQEPKRRGKGSVKSRRNARIYAMHKAGLGPQAIIEEWPKRYPEDEEYYELDEEVVKSAIRHFRGYLMWVGKASSARMGPLDSTERRVWLGK